MVTEKPQQKPQQKPQPKPKVLLVISYAPVSLFVGLPDPLGPDRVPFPLRGTFSDFDYLHLLLLSLGYFPSSNLSWYYGTPTYCLKEDLKDDR